MRGSREALLKGNNAIEKTGGPDDRTRTSLGRREPIRLNVSAQAQAAICGGRVVLGLSVRIACPFPQTLPPTLRSGDKTLSDMLYQGIESSPVRQDL